MITNIFIIGTALCLILLILYFFLEPKLKQLDNYSLSDIDYGVIEKPVNNESEIDSLSLFI